MADNMMYDPDDDDDYYQGNNGRNYLSRYDWKLNNFLYDAQSVNHPLNKNKEMFSLSFLGLNRKWKMRMQSKKREMESVGLVVYLHGQLLNHEEMSLKFTLSVLLEPEDEPLERCDFQSDFSDGEGHGGLLITKERLLENQGELMLAKNLIIRCEFYKMTISDSKSKQHGEKMLQLLNSTDDSDVTILTNDGVKYRAHKIFLCMYSDRFSKIIDDKEMGQTKTNELTINSCSEAIKIMLKFMYTGERAIFGDVNMAIKVLDLAEEYNIARLRNDCMYYLNLSIDVDNVLKILITAEKYKYPEIKRHAYDIVKQHLKEIIQTEDFYNFPRNLSYVMKDLLVKMAN